MKLSTASAHYVQLMRALGHRFLTGADNLKRFEKLCGDIELDQITSEHIRTFLHTKHPPHRFVHSHYYTLAGFFRCAVGRGYLTENPVPTLIPKESTSFVPFIFSAEQLRRVLEAAAATDDRRCRIAVPTFRALILLLYGTGLRIGEALSLTVSDVDLARDILVIRDSKFFKSRWVPMGPDVVGIVREQMLRRQRETSRHDAPFFSTRRGATIRRATAECHFRRARERAGVVRERRAVYQPRLHDLRHTFAVHRVIAWYREGADLQQMLPRLATYLGHINLTGTQRYLTLTPELLAQASARFERYAMGDRHG